MSDWQPARFVNPPGHNEFAKAILIRRLPGTPPPKIIRVRPYAGADNPWFTCQTELVLEVHPEDAKLYWDCITTSPVLVCEHRVQMD